MSNAKLVTLIICDGWGYRETNGSNAIRIANTPVTDNLMKLYPWTTLGASGEDVGLPEGQMGNSEVGHMNIGAGRVVLQEFQRINLSIRDGSFFKNSALKEAMVKAKKSNRTLHLMGLLSDGGVHSHINHIFALLDMACTLELKNVAIHAFLDGRDVPPRSAIKYIRMLEKKIADSKIGHIRTISGRYYAMDRDNRWERTALAYDAIVHSKGRNAATAEKAVEISYAEGKDDEFALPTVIGDVIPMQPEDTVIMFNFRPDRPRQLTRALIEREFKYFDRGKPEILPYLVTMTQYDDEFGVPVAFPPEKIRNTLADVLSEKGKRQLHIAETEKYAHVTYFFNGGEEEPKKGEDRILIPSPKVATYDLKPEMSAYEVAGETAKRINSGNYDFVVVNFANCDMVGHTGFINAAVKACEAVDSCVGIVLDAVESVEGIAFVTADHGNAELMEEDGVPFTAHTTSRVPFISVMPEKKRLRECGVLGDIAPTILEVMNLGKPEEMTGKSLFTDF